MRNELCRRCAKSQSAYLVPSVSTSNAKRRRFPCRLGLSVTFFYTKMQLFSCPVHKDGNHRKKQQNCFYCSCNLRELYFQKISCFNFRCIENNQALTLRSLTGVKLLNYIHMHVSHEIIVWAAQCQKTIQVFLSLINYEP